MKLNEVSTQQKQVILPRGNPEKVYAAASALQNSEFWDKKYFNTMNDEESRLYDEFTKAFSIEYLGNLRADAALYDKKNVSDAVLLAAINHQRFICLSSPNGTDIAFDQRAKDEKLKADGWKEIGMVNTYYPLNLVIQIFTKSKN